MILELLLYSKTVPCNIWLSVKLLSLSSYALHVLLPLPHHKTVHISLLLLVLIQSCLKLPMTMNPAFLANGHCLQECEITRSTKQEEEENNGHNIINKKWSYYNECLYRMILPAPIDKNFIAINICWQKMQRASS